MRFQLTKKVIEQVEQLIEHRDGDALKLLLHDFHFADIAELLEELDDLAFNSDQ